MSVQAGKLDQRIAIQAKTLGASSVGDENITWVTHVERWAQVVPLRGREFAAAAQMQDSVDYRVTIRYLQSVERGMRVVWNGLLLDIVAVIDVNGQHDSMELMCLSGVRNGI